MYKCMKCDRWVTKWGLYKIWISFGVAESGEFCMRKKICKRCARKEIKDRQRVAKNKLIHSYPDLE